jgi:hypothetical protein
MQQHHAANKQRTNLRRQSNHYKLPVPKDIYSRIDISQRYCRHGTFATINNCTVYCVVCLRVIHEEAGRYCAVHTLAATHCVPSTRNKHSPFHCIPTPH